MASVLTHKDIPGIYRSGKAQPVLGPRAHAVTMLFAAWTIFGIFLDGWAHSNVVETIESFFTPWHAVFYSGFALTALWIGYLIMREQTRGAGIDLSLIPRGYGLGVVGLGLFAAGGIGDMVWHTIFGIEEGTEALLSPTHLLLFLGTFLILTSPWRAEWHLSSEVDRSCRSFAPVLASLVLSTAGVAFFFMYLSPFTQWFPTSGYTEWATESHHDLVEMGQELGIASHIWMSLLLVVPLLVGLRRWRLPFGSAALLFTTVAMSLSAIEGEGEERAIAALIGGFAADWLIKAVRPAEGVWRFRALAALLPVPLWLATFALTEVLWGVGWVAEFWTGTICLASLSCLAVAYVMTLPPARDLPSR